MAPERAERAGGGPVGVAVVGAGYWGPNLIRNLASLPECRLVAVCDLDVERLDPIARELGVWTTTSLEELLAERSVEAVAIATPAATHRQVAEAALRAGRHVLVEKPLATDPADAAALVACARARRRVLMVGHLFAYAPAVARLAGLIAQGTIGELCYVHGVRTSMSGTARLDTGITWDALIHDAYLLPMLVGRRPIRVAASGSAYLSPGLEDVVFANLDFGQGVIAACYVSWYALEKARRYTVVGSRGILVYDDLVAPHLQLYDRRYERPGGRGRWQWHDGGARAIDVPVVEPLRAQCQHFLACIRDHRTPLTDGQAGLEAVRLVHAFQTSLGQGGAWVDCRPHRRLSTSEEVARVHGRV